MGGGGGAVPFFILSMNPMLNETGLERIGERREMQDHAAQSAQNPSYGDASDRCYVFPSCISQAAVRVR